MGQLFSKRLRNAAEDVAVAADRIDDLEDRILILEGELTHVSRELEETKGALTDAEEYGRVQFARAEALLRAGMHPQDRAIDTAAGNGVAPRPRYASDYGD